MNIFYKQITGFGPVNRTGPSAPDVSSTLAFNEYADDGDGDDNDDTAATTAGIRQINEPRFRVIMQTASRDVPGPRFFVSGCDYPTTRTTFRYSCANCVHDFESKLVQLRSRDEGESLVQICKKCSMKKINH